VKQLLNHATFHNDFNFKFFFARCWNYRFRVVSSVLFFANLFFMYKALLFRNIIGAVEY